MAATSPERRKLLGGVHAAAKAAGLEGDAYRDMLRAQTGKDSATACTDAELARVRAHLNTLAGGVTRTRRAADAPLAGKIRALWWSLHHLGVVRDPSDSALGAYLKRTAGVDALQWLDVPKATAVVEALKDWATRAAQVEWSAYTDPRHAVAVAQWSRLAALGAAPADLATTAAELAGKPLARFTATDWTKLHQALGARIRAALC